MVDRCVTFQQSRLNYFQCVSVVHFYDDNDEDLRNMKFKQKHHKHTNQNLNYHHLNQNHKHFLKPLLKHKPVYRKREQIILSTSPLQLGGLYGLEIKKSLNLKGFNGCVKNVKVNKIVSLDRFN